MSGDRPIAVVLLTGGLDSAVAAGIVQRQGIELVGLHVESPFHCGRGTLDRAVELLNIHCERRSVDEEYLNAWHRPRFGFGKGANPCTDCHRYLFGMADKLLAELGGEFVVSGEVLSQKPQGQKRQALLAVEQHSGLGDRLLRPLSAKLLPPTRPERAGRIDRGGLHGLSGAARGPIEVLARELGWQPAELKSSGCRMADEHLSTRLGDMLAGRPPLCLWSAGLIHVGRHFRTAGGEKIIVSRNAVEAERLATAQRNDPRKASSLIVPDDFAGPSALALEEDIATAIGLINRYSKSGAHNLVRITRPEGVVERLAVSHGAPADEMKAI
ncbi:MAG: hypothetical protein WEA31_06360 [Pirellulales bacterium]